MFDLGFQELIVIFLIALLVVGPKKLPELARTMGKWFGEIKRNLQNVKDQIETEFNAGDTPPVENAAADDPPDDEESAKNNSSSSEKEEKA